MAAPRRIPVADSDAIARRRRWREQFERARARLRQAPADREAARLLAECVAAEPDNAIFLEVFLPLVAQAPRRRPGWWTRAFGGWGRFHRALARQDWQQALSQGPALLCEFPHQPRLLAGLAEACRHEGYRDAELRHLQAWLSAEPHSAEPHRWLARWHARRGGFDAAWDHWAAAHEIDPADAEARAKLAWLRPAGADNEGLAAWQSAWAQAPSDPAACAGLATGLSAAGRFAEAERVLRAGLAAGGNAIGLQEQLEALLLARAERHVLLAEEQAAADPETEENLAAAARQERDRLEIEVLAARARRYPQERTWSFQLGQKLQAQGQAWQAAQCFEEAADDPTLAPAALLAWGECRQQLRQFGPALDLYRRSLAAGEAAADAALRWKTLYRAAVLAEAMGETAAARGWLSELVAAEPGYKDAASRLDKLPAIGDKA